MNQDLLKWPSISTGWQVVACLEPHSCSGDMWPFARLDGTRGWGWIGTGDQRSSASSLFILCFSWRMSVRLGAEKSLGVDVFFFGFWMIFWLFFGLLDEVGSIVLASSCAFMDFLMIFSVFFWCFPTSDILVTVFPKTISSVWCTVPPHQLVRWCQNHSGLQLDVSLGGLEYSSFNIAFITMVQALSSLWSQQTAASASAKNMAFYSREHWRICLKKHTGGEVFLLLK